MRVRRRIDSPCGGCRHFVRHIHSSSQDRFPNGQELHAVLSVDPGSVRGTDVAGTAEGARKTWMQGRMQRLLGRPCVAWRTPHANWMCRAIRMVFSVSSLTPRSISNGVMRQLAEWHERHATGATRSRTRSSTRRYTGQTRPSGAPVIGLRSATVRITRTRKVRAPFQRGRRAECQSLRERVSDPICRSGS